MRTFLAGLAALVSATSAAAQGAPAESDAAEAAAKIAKTHIVAQCLVRDFRPQVMGILQLRPGASAERTRLDALRRDGVSCAELVVRLDKDTQYLASFEINHTALRGALAEALYRNDLERPDRVSPDTLAQIPAADEAARAGSSKREALAELRRFASCAAADGGEEASALLATEPASAAEAEAVRRLVRELDVCFSTSNLSPINIPTLRGVVAEAVYRQRAAIARGEPASGGSQIVRRGAADSGAVAIIPAGAQAAGAAGSPNGYDAEDARNLLAFSRCVARRRPADAAELLTMDYRGDAYDSTARFIASYSVACVPRGRLRFSRLLFAGGLAEEMLASRTKRENPLTSFTAASVSGAQEEDAILSIGTCLVRAEPAGVAGLLATPPASPEEDRVVRELTAHVAACVAPGRTTRLSQPALRAAAAIAAYRLANGGTAISPARN